MSFLGAGANPGFKNAGLWNMALRSGLPPPRNDKNRSLSSSSTPLFVCVDVLCGLGQFWLGTRFLQSISHSMHGGLCSRFDLIRKPPAREIANVAPADSRLRARKPYGARSPISPPHVVAAAHVFRGRLGRNTPAKASDACLADASVVPGCVEAALSRVPDGVKPQGERL